LKIDRYMLRGVWQALNCLFIHATFCVIAIFCNCGSNNLETVVYRRVHAAMRFYRATLCKRGPCCHAVFVCSSVCLSVRPSVTFVDHVKTNKHILEFLSPSGSHTFLVRQNVLQYLNNFTKQYRAVCQR